MAFAEPLKGEICEGYHVEPLLFSRSELKCREFTELAFSRCLNRDFVNPAPRSVYDAAGDEHHDLVQYQDTGGQWADLRDGRTVMAQLAAAFEHFNEVHPHSALKMKSPRELRRQRAA